MHYHLSSCSLITKTKFKTMFRVSPSLCQHPRASWSGNKQVSRWQFPSGSEVNLIWLASWDHPFKGSKYIHCEPLWNRHRDRPFPISNPKYSTDGKAWELYGRFSDRAIKSCEHYCSKQHAYKHKHEQRTHFEPHTTDQREFKGR